MKHPKSFSEVTGIISLGLHGKNHVAEFSKNPGSNPQRVLMSSDKNLLPFFELFASELKHSNVNTPGSFIISSPSEQECLRVSSILYRWLIHNGYGQAKTLVLAHYTRSSSEVNFPSDRKQVQDHFKTLQWNTMDQVMKKVKGYLIVRIIPTLGKNEQIAQNEIKRLNIQNSNQLFFHGEAQNSMDKGISATVCVTNSKAISGLIFETRYLYMRSASPFSWTLLATFPLLHPVDGVEGAKEMAMKILGGWSSAENDEGNPGKARAEMIRNCVGGIKRMGGEEE